MKPDLESKPLFVERMKLLLGDEYENYVEFLSKPELKSIRVNTLKTSPSELKKMLEEKGWEIKQPFKNYPEIMIVEPELLPGELGRSLEHILGYYYAQEIASMLPVIVLNPQPGEKVLDIAAAPGSKTTQIAMMMKNSGLIIANDVKLPRIKILASNLERCGVTNEIITRSSGQRLCEQLKKQGFLFDKILLDAPCSGEGTLRSTPRSIQMWNIQRVYRMSKEQKRLLISALEVLKIGGEIVYSTCTHAPEENEEVIDSILNEFKNIKVEKIILPIKCKSGLTSWKGKNYNKELKNSCRIYPHISDTEGFFIAKLRKTK
ncbi:RsmB/NOP family class I SAM-dependent RNA methyltransferase [Candidatus Pacearchaeota archaeon]|nr:RsmB/NOP family class I SAM-dependent RNA methyltransferase [Candidatus Pacearchaeota archaeon]